MIAPTAKDMVTHAVHEMTAEKNTSTPSESIAIEFLKIEAQRLAKELGALCTTLTITASSHPKIGGVNCFAHASGHCGDGTTVTGAINDLKRRLLPETERAALAHEKRRQAQALLNEADELENE